ncbi:5-oxoprolinase subunit B family protein [Janibacter indicus]|uniref:Sensor histidine kinase inhibitor, KipI family n=1 Tax=Janibacter indicus TaxID=857417 RepID=A0A1W2C3L7_9MICO|nr:allophanate hydrolase subunit 1 [Janibacter indicus]SMC79837.1 sensor histidine kinase inhibitor, KipI family [Janibacter indicus]
MPAGDTALLVELADLDEVLSLYARLDEDLPDGVVDLVPAATTLLLTIDPRVTDVEGLARRVSGITVGSHERATTGEVEIPVVYDGEDLAEVGRITGLGERGVIEAHTGTPWTVAFCGFAPGFGYMVGGDERLRVPRRDNPRTRVPAGSVAIAGEFASVYPRESPGGWQLIGRTALEVWDIGREPPALLVPGTTVRYVEVSS